MPQNVTPRDIERREKLGAFVAWVNQNITGDEKGEAQIFLDRLLQAFGQKGTLDIGGKPEMRIRKASEDGGGVSFADFVWKPIVLVEMKKRGTDLRRHFRQAFDYWVRLVPGRPRYVVLCNFDEFHIYDFERQIDDPVDTLQIAELPERWGPLAFLYPTNEAPEFENDREAVTRKAADALASCFSRLTSRRIPRDLARRFVLQSLVALFAEDIELLPKYFFKRLLNEASEAPDPRAAGYDLIGGLFEAMNTDPPATGGRFKDVRYFNGGLFLQPARLEIETFELADLRRASTQHWGKVSPEIFGTLFEHSADAGERAAFGQQFTLPVDIMKIVKPTIVDPFSESIESARSGRRLVDLLDRLTTLRVLDPACGSGNFLYVAYRQMRRLEHRIRQRLKDEFPGEQAPLIHVNARQFFGIDISPFAVDLAKVTMMIARKLAIDELDIADEPALPLDNLDANFRAGDALIESEPAGTGGDRAGWRTPLLTDHGKPRIVRWPAADVLIGNPPFNGAKKLKPDLGDAYVDALRSAYPDVPGMADYCVYWFRRAHDHLPECTKQDLFAGRAGLVGTQNVRNNKSREGGLDHIAASGTIIDAVDNQPWSGEANVHVSIVNWIKTQDEALVPKKRHLWKVASKPFGKRPRAAKGEGPSSKQYELDEVITDDISSSLSDKTDVAGAKVLSSVTDPQRSFNGVIAGYPGFVISLEQRRAWIEDDRRNAEVVRPLLIGRDLLTGRGRPTTALIDFGTRDQLVARRFDKPFAHLQKNVLPEVHAKAETATGTSMAAARAEHLERWWQLWNVRQYLRDALGKLSRFIGVSRVTKRPIFVFVSTDILPDTQVQVFAFEDDYSFGVIQTTAHFRWFLTKSSKLKSDYRYTRRSVWDTFPWPQSPSDADVLAVAEAARRVRAERANALRHISGGLRGVYQAMEQPGAFPLRDAHAALDAAVLKAYGFAPGGDLLADLLRLNFHIASAERAGGALTPPGIPASFAGDRINLMSEDCVTAGPGT